MSYEYKRATRYLGKEFLTISLDKDQPYFNMVKIADAVFKWSQTVDDPKLYSYVITFRDGYARIEWKKL